MRTCHICGAVGLYDECPMCRRAFDYRKPAEDMTKEERIDELEQWFGPIEIEFSLIHKRIEELVGRPVWTHELADPESLYEEIRSGKMATFEDVVDKAEKLKPGGVVVVR